MKAACITIDANWVINPFDRSSATATSVEELGLDSGEYGTRSSLRTKASMIQKATHNLRTIQILLDHS